MKKKICLSILVFLMSLPMMVDATVVNDHTTLGYTKEEVIQKFQESQATYDYSKGYYDASPVFTPSSYFEGSLQEGVKEDVLRQYNFYRWVSGLNTVTINESKMARSQKGAFINALNDVLTHTPEKPDGMSDDFYKEAYAGNYASVVAGDTYSGNVSWGTAVKDVVKGYVDDSSNVEANVGHRSSMLYPFAKQISFGYVESFSAVSVYYDSTNLNSDSFYAWPPAGYLPVESFPATEKTMWSIWIGDYKTDSNTKVSIAYEGKTYEITGSDLYYDPYTTTLFYYVPSELNKVIISNNQYVTDKQLNFTISNLKKGNDDVTIEYPTTFIKADIVNVEDATFALDINGKDTNVSTSVDLENGKTYSYHYAFSPSNATIGDIQLSSSDRSILEVDATQKTVTAKKGGTVTLVLKDTLSGFTKAITIVVKESVSSVNEAENDVLVQRFDLISQSDIEVIEGKTAQIEVEITPSNATEQDITWKSSNETVATVKDGTVSGLKSGTATITGTLKNGMKVEVNVTVKTIPMKSMEFEETEVTLYRNENKELSLVFDPVDTTEARKIVWTSSDEKVATVKDGVVTALSEGTATIKAQMDDIIRECEVTVVEVHLESVSVVETKNSIVIGEQTQLNLLLNPTNVTDDYVVTYTSSDNHIATIDENGMITGVGVGEAILTVDVNGMQVTHNVKVSQPVSPKTGVGTVYGSMVISVLSLVGIGALLRKRAKLK